MNHGDAAALVSVLQDAVPDAQFDVVANIDPQPTLYVPREHLLTAARTLRDRPDLRFSVLVDITAVDFYPREPRFEVVYMLLSIEHRRRARLKVRLTADGARVSTLSDLWPAANWLEREVWDMFGIEFEGHPDPRRLLMPEDWEGYPLRKDYPVQINMKARTSEPVQVTEEEFRASLLKDRLVRQP